MFNLIGVRKVVDKKVYVNYYLECNNGTRIAIKPSFVNDYGKLRALCSSLVDSKDEK